MVKEPFNEPAPTDSLLGQTDDEGIRLVVISDGNLHGGMCQPLHPFRKFVLDITVNLLENLSESDNGHTLQGRRSDAHAHSQPILDLQRDTWCRRSKGDIKDIADSIVAVVQRIELEFLN